MNEPVGVLVIGAGASGAAFAWRIADIGTSVLCLEQGPWMRQQDYPSNGLDWEARGMGEYSPSPNVRRLPADYPVNEQDSEISPLMFNAVGGSTILWAAHFPRLTPSDFRTKTEDGVGEDWPIDYETLEPYYALNDRMMGVSGLPGDPAYPYHEPPLPPLPLGKTGNALAHGFEKLGWHWWPSDSAILSREYEGRAACINLGPCLTGCAQGAKASTDITYWPAAQRKGVAVTHRLPRARDHCASRRDGGRSPLLRRGGPAARAEGGNRGAGLQRYRDAAAAAQLEEQSTSRRTGQQQRPGGQEPDVSSVHDGHGQYSRSVSVAAAPWAAHSGATSSIGVTRRAGSCEGTRSRRCGDFGPAQTALWGMIHGLVPWGEDHHRGVCQSLRPYRDAAGHYGGPARSKPTESLLTRN